MDTTSTEEKFKIKFVLGLDGRSSFITYNKPFFARIGGLRLGIEVGKLRVGVGFYGLSTDYETMDTSETGDIFTYRLNFNYFSYFAEYLFYQNKRWEVSLPVYIGYGFSALKFTSLNGIKGSIDKRPVILIEPVIACQYKLKHWIGIGTGLGYRRMIVSNKVMPVEFNSLIYIVKVKLFLGEIYKGIKGIKDSKKDGSL